MRQRPDVVGTYVRSEMTRESAYQLLSSTSPRLWRNWSTRTVQVRVGASPWGFESLQPHRVGDA
jgi:hypothetical protein